jgi:hypothetical protein
VGGRRGLEVAGAAGPGEEGSAVSIGGWPWLWVVMLVVSGVRRVMK